MLNLYIIGIYDKIMLFLILISASAGMYGIFGMIEKSKYSLLSLIFAVFCFLLLSIIPDIETLKIILGVQ